LFGATSCRGYPSRVMSLCLGWGRITEANDGKYVVITNPSGPISPTHSISLII
jgi:hypothetical protein